MEKTWSTLDVVAPVVNLYIAISYVGFCSMEKFLEELGGVAVYID